MTAAELPPTTDKPIKWDEARKYIQNGAVECIGHMLRSLPMQQKYQEQRDKVTKEYASMADYLQVKTFKTPAAPGEDGRLVAQTPQPAPDSQPVTVWKPNDFPYLMEDCVQQWVLWADRPLPTEPIERMTQERFPGHETLQWVNPKVKQSVAAIWHAHVLVRDCS